jgi:hypothetical protein
VNLLAIEELRAFAGPDVLVTATADYDDEVAELEELGVSAFRRSTEAGQGFADFSLRALSARD